MYPVYNENDPYEELARGLIRLSFVLRQDLETELNTLSEVPREFVRLIVRMPGLTVAELADIAAKQKSNASAAVAELHRKGFARREPNAADRRSVRVYPTEKAENEIRRIYRQWSRDLQSWASGLPQTQRDALLGAVLSLGEMTVIAERGHDHALTHH